MAKWTKGPWEAMRKQDNVGKVDADVWGSIKNGDDWHVARIWGDVSKGESEANAKLIAKSPEMAELLRELKTDADLDSDHVDRIEKLLSEIGAGD